eukprot:TRINITY_DN5832_c0_g1_i1.p1 TRINITY_DN5832_c0_g1~~TRINITY_DN5832_c0_g1_i1.p1  ORF type:complete len:274 (+),score=71.39 TRINITY_DN5832_c0_g1_i1:57-878(+)
MGNNSSRGELLEDTIDPKLLLRAAEKGDLSLVEHYISIGVDVNYQESTSKWTALHYATTEGHVEIVRSLIHAHAMVDLASSDGTTPLILAASMNNVRIMAYLCQAGASLKKENFRGMTPLAIAAKVGNKDAVKWMLKAGADPSQPLSGGVVLLDLCQDATIVEMIKGWVESPVRDAPITHSISEEENLKSAPLTQRDLSKSFENEIQLSSTQVDENEIASAIMTLKQIDLDSLTLVELSLLESELKGILGGVTKRKAELDANRLSELDMLEQD